MRAAAALGGLLALVPLGARAQSAAPLAPPPPSVRLAPLPEAHWSAETRAALGRTLPRVSALGGDGSPAAAPKPLPILTYIAHHPTLLSPFIEFASALAQRGVLSRRESELIALRVVWRAQSPFEWGHHVLYARAAGIGDAEIARVAEQGDAPLSPRELLLLRAADELFAEQRFRDDTWAALRAAYSDAQLVEIPFLAGQYTMLSMVAEGLGVPLEDGLPDLPPLR
jgi:alkylhydroperoxidase family enzyme